MHVLITGAAGNLGSFLAQFLANTRHRLRLMWHHTELEPDLLAAQNASAFKADLADPATLSGCCEGIDCIVHFAGVLFEPRPSRFLPTTNVEYVRNLLDEALEAGVGKFVLVSFPHVEGPTTPKRPAAGRLDRTPPSVHAQTRLQAERMILGRTEGTATTAVILRSGTIYGRGVLMLEAARWLMRRRMLPVWRSPTWYHFLSLPDFLNCTQAAIENERADGIYQLGDDLPLTLQEGLDQIADHWGYPRPLRLPSWTFYLAATAVESYARMTGKPAPLHRDFIRIGMVSHVGDTARMKRDLLPRLEFPTLEEGLVLI